MTDVISDTSHGNLGLERVLRDLASGQPNVVKKSMTFAGGTTNDPGDYDGTGNPATLFTVTGNVLMYLVPVCTTLLAGATATLEIGVATATAALVAQTTATDIDAGEGWFAATPTLAVANTAQYHVVSGNVIQTAATANITAGVIDYYCFWKPLSADGNVIAA